MKNTMTTGLILTVNFSGFSGMFASEFVSADFNLFDNPDRQINDSIPDWVTTCFEELGYYENVEALDFKQLNDSLSYAILEIGSTVCLAHHVVVFNNTKFVEEAIIYELCDRDFSAPFYEWKKYVELKNSTFRVVTYREEIPDSILTNGKIPVGRQFEDFPMTIDSVVRFIEILDSGVLTKQDN